MARRKLSTNTFRSAWEGTPMTQSIMSPPSPGAPVPILIRGEVLGPQVGNDVLDAVVPPAEPVGRTRSFPTGNDTSSSDHQHVVGRIL